MEMKGSQLLKVQMGLTPIMGMKQLISEPQPDTTSSLPTPVAQGSQPEHIFTMNLITDCMSELAQVQAILLQCTIYVEVAMYQSQYLAPAFEIIQTISVMS